MSSINLKRTAVWLPETYEDSQYIADQSGIPKDVIEKKMGIIKKCRAPLDCHPSQMAVNAAKRVLEGIDPNSIDLVIWTGSEYKDYHVWSAGIFVQRELGLKKAWAFDMAARCSSNVVGLKIAKNMMMADKKINRVLLCGGHRTGDLVNYKDETSRFLYNLSDGGAAILVERSDVECNPILESSIITDGDFSLDVIIPGGGTKKRSRDGLGEFDTYLTCPDIQGMRERLADRSIENFLHVIRESASDSSKACGGKPIDYLSLLHMKKSAHDAILEGMELRQEQSIYLDQYGHFGAPDQVLSLGLAERRGLLKKGDHVSLASAGIGYTWSAISVRWDEPTFNQEALNGFEN